MTVEPAVHQEYTARILYTSSHGGLSRANVYDTVRGRLIAKGRFTEDFDAKAADPERRRFDARDVSVDIWVPLREEGSLTFEATSTRGRKPLEGLLAEMHDAIEQAAALCEREDPSFSYEVETQQLI